MGHREESGDYEGGDSSQDDTGKENINNFPGLSEEIRKSEEGFVEKVLMILGHFSSVP